MKALLLIFGLLFASCTLVEEGDTLVTPEKEVEEEAEQEEKSLEEELGEDVYPTFAKYRQTFYDCYSDEDILTLTPWSPIPPFIVCDIGVELGHREVVIIDAESNRESKTSQHNRRPQGADFPGDAIDFHFPYKGNCEDVNDQHLENFLNFRGRLNSTRWGEFCSVGFYPRRLTIHLDCRTDSPKRWCHYYEGEELVRTTIPDCIFNYASLKREC